MLRKLPPLVSPKKYPSQIIDERLDFYEKENIIEHLEKYKTSSGEWDAYRKKIPSPLLEKFALVLRECRENGFIAPRVKNGEIKWQQVMGAKRSFQNADKCSL